MANSGAFHPSITLQALIIIYVLSVLVADVGCRNHCPPFSCGDLRDISYPFRRPGDPSECGVQAYELVCSSSKATIKINTGTYYVTYINYAHWNFRVVDANMDMQSSCPLPRWDQHPYTPWESDGLVNLVTETGFWLCFVNCSREITNNSRYTPVTCLSENNSFVYVWAGYCDAGWLEPSCGYSGMIPFSSWMIPYLLRQNASYADIKEFIGHGFLVRFPIRRRRSVIKICLNDTISYFKEQISSASILNRTRAFFWSEIIFVRCIDDYTKPTDKLHLVVVAIVSAIDITKSLVVLCRFVFLPLAVLIFLAHKFWKTRVTIDAVERFLRMQQMIGPTRYAYTDITAITSHFRDKLGQGGYGSVYKGTLLPGDVHVAVKMLGNSNCNGEEFISEVATIGRIHHVNVVRLVGFCSEEMRRALVYEYMPRGSLDKYIFSAEKSFSWDKLNKIALVAQWQQRAQITWKRH